MRYAKHLFLESLVSGLYVIAHQIYEYYVYGIPKNYQLFQFGYYYFQEFFHIQHAFRYIVLVFQKVY